MAEEKNTLFEAGYGRMRYLKNRLALAVLVAAAGFFTLGVAFAAASYYAAGLGGGIIFALDLWLWRTGKRFNRNMVKASEKRNLLDSAYEKWKQEN